MDLELEPFWFPGKVRSAAASPLRKALEVHDTLSVLAAYGAGISVLGALGLFQPELFTTTAAYLFG